MCIALLLSSQAELCLYQLISLVSPCQAGLCTALGTMPCEKFRRSYPVCAGKCKRAFLWEQVGLCDEIWPLPWFISQFKWTERQISLQMYETHYIFKICYLSCSICSCSASYWAPWFIVLPLQQLSPGLPLINRLYLWLLDFFRDHSVLFHKGEEEHLHS